MKIELILKSIGGLCVILFLYSCQTNQASNLSDTEINEKTVQEPTSLSSKPTEKIETNETQEVAVLDFYLTPSRSEELVQETGRLLIDFLEKETSYTFRLKVPENYEEMLESFSSNEGDVALMNSSSYIKAHDLYGAQAKLRAVRYGRSSYFGQIVANADKGISSIKDLAGKSMVYTDTLSASGYLFPKNIIEKNEIELGNVAFAGTHDRVIKMVYKGIADAGATYYSEPATDGTIRDARSRLVEEYPDVESKVKILQVTDPIPNDPVVFAKHISKQMSFDISLAIIKFMETEVGKKAMNELYSIEGYVRCSDSDYNVLREVLQ
ncbi:phosphate/phosphite/phosphonate ABC transporter substrate-binding protein [Reichenbachiella ulvae]|uniref:Phosphate/phosphite/phosphonate ABC transporter substrate-binding protein n=1 Tax=Reichenbachiella ulvae TaxID=2980104 RepID=A0ABT3CXI2_9BACT|nr:phosphate/phosphite/phosphonate ABC transporter substrate-binding protein [Reichenbachiella ulvae]MCV9388406.1 phosphate/phosphite/phosphonate ABC transporter substrate-binding protein [Reichenbachiella ulvae]